MAKSGDGITSYRLADGTIRWMVRYRIPNTPKQTTVKGFRTRRVAEEWKAANVLLPAGRGTYQDPRAGFKTTVGEVAEEWLAVRDVEATSNARTRSIVRIHILPRWGTVPVAAVNKFDAQAWVNSFTKAGAAPATVKKHKDTLTMIMQAAMDKGLRDDNPCDRVKAPSVKRGAARKGKTMTSEQLAQLLDHKLIRGHADRTGIILVLASCGLRFSELAGLYRRDIDLDERVLHVRQPVVQVDGIGQVRKDYPKNGEHREARLPRRIIDPLRFALAGKAPGDVAFPGERSGTPLWRQSTKRAWLDPAVKAVGGETGEGDEAVLTFTWHDFRRTHVSQARAHGADTTALRKGVGHGDMETLDRYTFAVNLPGTAPDEAMDVVWADVFGADAHPSAHPA